MDDKPETMRKRAGARFERVFRELIAHRLTLPQLKSNVLRQTFRDVYIRGWIDSRRPGADDELPPPDRVMPTRTGARTVTSKASNSNLSGRTTGDATGTPEAIQLGLYSTGVSKEVEGGTGEEGATADFGTTVPPALADFDATLRQLGKRYQPTAKFYERVVEQYAGLAGLDLVYEAEGIVRYCMTTPKGRTRTDIPRTAERWLSNTRESLGRAPRNGAGGPRTGYNTPRPYGMGSASQEAQESARRFMRRADDDDDTR